MRTIVAIFVALVVPNLCCAQTAELSVTLRDGDPHDRIYIHNTGECALVRGVLGIDFAPSQGRVLIDTQYGGLGTKDPMPVNVEHGPLHVQPVLDGDRQITIQIDGLQPAQSGTVTLDVDNEATGWFAGRVIILGDHVEGATARFAGGGQDVLGTFTNDGAVVLTLANGACAQRDVPTDLPVTTVPIS